MIIENGIPKDITPESIKLQNIKLENSIDPIDPTTGLRDTKTIEKVIRNLKSADPEGNKKVTIWVGISAGKYDMQRRFERAYKTKSQQILEKIAEIESFSKIESKTESENQQHQKAKDALNKLYDELHQKVELDEHRQKGAHLASFMDSILELVKAMQQANVTLNSIVFYDTTALHGCNAPLVKELRAPNSEEKLESIKQEFRQRIHEETLKEFGIEYEAVARLLKEPLIKNGVQQSGGNTLLFTGEKWKEAYNLLKDLTTDKECLRPEAVRSEANILQNVRILSDWCKGAAKLFGKPWEEAYELLKDAAFTYIEDKGLKPYGIFLEGPSKEISLISSKQELSDYREKLKNRFKEWKKWYVAASLEKNSLEKKSKTPKLFAKSWKAADVSLQKIIQAVTQEFSKREDLKQILDYAKKRAFELFAKKWEQEDRPIVEAKIQAFQGQAIKTEFQFWKDWEQTQEAEQYAAKSDEEYLNNAGKLREKAHEAAKRRINNEIQNENNGALIKEIDETNLSHVLILKYILREMDRVAYLAEEYERSILSYPSLEPPPAINHHLVTHKHLMGLISNPKNLKNKKDAAILYLGYVTNNKNTQKPKKLKKNSKEALVPAAAVPIDPQIHPSDANFIQNNSAASEGMLREMMALVKETHKEAQVARQEAEAVRQEINALREKHSRLITQVVNTSTQSMQMFHQIRDMNEAPDMYGYLRATNTPQEKKRSHTERQIHEALANVLVEKITGEIEGVTDEVAARYLLALAEAKYEEEDKHHKKPRLSPVQVKESNSYLGTPIPDTPTQLPIRSPSFKIKTVNPPEIGSFVTTNERPAGSHTGATPRSQPTITIHGPQVYQSTATGKHSRQDYTSDSSNNNSPTTATHYPKHRKLNEFWKFFTPNRNKAVDDLFAYDTPSSSDEFQEQSPNDPQEQLRILNSAP